MHPHLLQFGRLVLPTYGFLLALGIVVSLLVCLRTARLLSIDPDKIWKVAVLAIVVAVVGNRILLAVPRWSGYGFAVEFTSTLIAAAGSAFYARHLDLPLRRTADAFAPSLALGTSIASIGCLEAGCDYGTPTNLPWAVAFRSPAALPSAMLGVPLHPTQLYACLAEFALFVVLLWLLYRPHYDGEVLGAWLFLAGLCNFLIEFVRGDRAWMFSGWITVTQLVAAAMVLAGGMLWLHPAQVSHGR